MSKLIPVVLGIALAAAGGAAVQLAAPGDDASATTTPTATATTTRSLEQQADRGTARSRGKRGRPARRAAVGREAGEDVRGPCDEAEHANDPRCVGGAAGGDGDRSGRRRGDEEHDDHDEDRSGSNSGRS